MLAGILALILLSSAALLTTETPMRLLSAILAQEATPVPGAHGTATQTSTPDLTATYNINATQFASWMATYVATTGVTPTPSPDPTSTPSDDLTLTATTACVFDMATVRDWSVWPSVLMPRQQFVKRWTVQNVGTCAWPENVQLVFVSGDQLDITKQPQIGALAPDGTTEINITLRAPASYARYTSVWQLQDSAGHPIGEELSITCRVGPTPTPRPTTTPTATLPAQGTPTPAEPFHFSVPIVVTWEDTGTGKWRADAGLTAWGGQGNYRYYLNYVSNETEFFNGTFEIEAEVCTAWWGTVIVTSGDETKRWEGKIPYPDLTRCD